MNFSEVNIGGLEYFSQKFATFGMGGQEIGPFLIIIKKLSLLTEKSEQLL
jgi:hypothetical protein